MERTRRQAPRYPSLYQVNTRVWLTELSRHLGRPATLDDVPDAEFDRLAAQGFDWIWLLSVWKTGLEGQRVSRANAEWRREFEHTLPDLSEEDIAGSGFAITGYTVSEALGGDAALARLRARIAARGMRLMLDFVPNHTGVGHPWVDEHPEYFVAGTGEDLARAPANYTRVTRAGGGLVLAHGRDPYFPGWPDTLQLDYGNPATQEAMLTELMRIAGQCDGVRCDMAMLLLPEVFERMWGRPAPEFWPSAIRRVREQVPGFCLVAEAYWDLEWDLQQRGFDYTYDKRLYDRLREGRARPVREHLHSELDFQARLVRFLENHHEPRAAATFGADMHWAAAVITFLSPGMRLFHQGQLDGRRTRISPHLVRGPDEAVNAGVAGFYARLLAVLTRPAVRDGEWKLLPCGIAWDGNQTWDNYVAFSWQSGDDDRLVVAVNAGAVHSQGFVRLPFRDLVGSRWRLEDLLGGAVYERDGGDLHTWGLFLDEPPWKAQVFSMTRA
ncbi:MAG: alpha-amylase family glycosyl hydrolase [Vicinamibacterales bacterium]